MTAPVLGDGSAVYTPGVSQRRAGSTTYDLHDQLGSAVKQTNSSASITAARTYDAFGMLLASSGTPQGAFGFASTSGYQEDGDSGLKLLGHRYYDPSTGRFLTRDPAQDGCNWYAYVDGNPTGDVDEDGLQKGKWIPPSQRQRPRYPNGKPKPIIIRYPSRKGAEDGAKQESGKGQPIINDGDHFHGRDGKGNKLPTHHTWFEGVDWGRAAVLGGAAVAGGVIIIFFPETLPLTGPVLGRLAGAY